jgi:hypothetical protein
MAESKRPNTAYADIKLGWTDQSDAGNGGQCAGLEHSTRHHRKIAEGHIERADSPTIMEKHVTPQSKPERSTRP